MSKWLNPKNPQTGNGRTSRDIYGGKINTDVKPKGDLEVVYRTADGKPVEK